VAVTTYDQLPQADLNEHVLALRWLGCALIAQGRLAEADRVFARALEVAADSAWHRAFSLRGLADLRLVQARGAEAESALREALGLYEGEARPDARLIAMTLLEIGMLLGGQEHHGEAEAALRRSLAELDNCGWNSGWRAAVAKNELAACLAARGELEAAGELWAATRSTLTETTTVPLQLRERTLASTIRAMDAYGSGGRESEPYRAALAAMHR
jgi:tetratricopeptide (TPR) repeat protein